MKLLSAQVTNFRSAEDTGEFTLDHLTCLVGKNEAGKTVILQALAGLNPHPATPFEYTLERDYPKRYLARYAERHPDEGALVIKSKWAITDEAKGRLVAEFGPDSVTGNTVTLTRGYGSPSPRWVLPINEATAVSYIISNAGFSAPEKSQVGAPRTSGELREKLKTLAPTNPKHKALLTKIETYPKHEILRKARELLETDLPKFMYFSSYDRMSATVHLPNLSVTAENKTLFSDDNLRGDRLFLEFLEFAGIGLNDIIAAKTFESFNAKLQAASNILTEEILDFWTQNPDIEVRVNVAEGKPGDPAPFNSGPIGRARIYNQLHRADTSFSERSAVFTWFFSFLIKFDRVKREGAGPIFLLLDEPGLTLHGKAQGDLLRYFKDKLSPHHQVVYSTHSPFMVPPDGMMETRIVEDLVNVDQRGRRTPVGTKVRGDALSEDNAVNQLVVMGVLENAGHVGTVAVNGREAIERFAEGDFDAILMDI
ncbi:MAG: AAA family ATPase, partial [Alphaproteobacteria bacterium]|nr:AAA family ATPase [Alphaproteobacteria bacterium]